MKSEVKKRQPMKPPVRTKPKPVVDLVEKKRKSEREKLFAFMRDSNLTVDEKRAMVRKFDGK